MKYENFGPYERIAYFRPGRWVANSQRVSLSRPSGSMADELKYGRLATEHTEDTENARE